MSKFKERRNFIKDTIANGNFNANAQDVQSGTTKILELYEGPNKAEDFKQDLIIVIKQLIKEGKKKEIENLCTFIANAKDHIYVNFHESKPEHLRNFTIELTKAFVSVSEAEAQRMKSVFWKKNTNEAALYAIFLIELKDFYRDKVDEILTLDTKTLSRSIESEMLRLFKDNNKIDLAGLEKNDFLERTIELRREERSSYAGITQSILNQLELDKKLDKEKVKWIRQAVINSLQDNYFILEKPGDFERKQYRLGTAQLIENIAQKLEEKGGLSKMAAKAPKESDYRIFKKRYIPVFIIGVAAAWVLSGGIAPLIVAGSLLTLGIARAIRVKMGNTYQKDAASFKSKLGDLIDAKVIEGIAIKRNLLKDEALSKEGYQAYQHAESALDQLYKFDESGQRVQGFEFLDEGKVLDEGKEVNTQNDASDHDSSSDEERPLLANSRKPRRNKQEKDSGSGSVLVDLPEDLPGDKNVPTSLKSTSYRSAFDVLNKGRNLNSIG